MRKPLPARYHTTNWSSYDSALRKRGSLLIWVEKAMAWLAPYEGRPGRPAFLSSAAIQYLPVGEGFVKAVAQADRRDGGQPLAPGGAGLSFS